MKRKIRNQRLSASFGYSVLLYISNVCLFVVLVLLALLGDTHENKFLKLITHLKCPSILTTL